MKNSVLLSVSALGVTAMLVWPAIAEARSHHKPAAAEKPAAAAAASSKPTLVGTYGEWGAYVAQGKAKICYALAQPKDRSPGSLKKDTAYIFISNRPAENVKNEISVIMGTALKENSDAKAEIGSTTFDLVAKGQNAWVKNAADETRFIESMKKGSRMVVKGSLAKSGAVTDTYALGGLAQALDRVTKECRS